MKEAILLLAYGGPEKTEEIEPFLKQLLRRDPLPPGLLQRVEKKYQAIGGGSPLPSICRLIRKKLSQELDELPVFLAFRYAEPSIEKVVKEMTSQGVTRIFALSLSPHSSTISSAAYYKTLEEVTATGKLELVRLENWYRETAYNQLIAARILETAREKGFQLDSEKTHIIFSAHNIPQSYIDQGDTYVDEITANIRAIKALLPQCRSSLAYQSKGKAPGAWLEPEIEDHLLELKQKGCSNFIVVPISFSMDHLETLYDLDQELKTFCDDEGLNLCRSQPANADDDFIAMLTQFIKKAQ
ncbi:MAG: ferrochelatase [Pseudomonadota bacterium]|nr:ferrochelatase [Pseudomonadota bacterium]